MNKFYFALLLFTFCALKSQCEETTDNFYINDFTIAPGEQKTIELNLLNTQPYKSIQVNVYLPEGLSFVYDEDEESYVYPTERIPRTWTYLQTDIVSDGSLLVSAYKSKPTNKDLVAGDGAVFEFNVVAANDFAGGVIYCRRSVLTDASNTSNYGPDTECNVSVIKSVTLAELVADGKVNANYEITNPLTCAYITEDGTTIFAKDDNGFALKDQPPYVATEDQPRYERPEDFDQSNWVEIVLPEPITTITQFQAINEHLITGIKGKLLDKVNPKLQATVMPTATSTESPYTPNCYIPANFSQNTYFLMPPKPQEFAMVKWAVYKDGAFYVPQKTATSNVHDLNGAVAANMELYRGDELVDNTIYILSAIIRAKDIETPSTLKADPILPKEGELSDKYVIYPLLAETNDTITDITDIKGDAEGDGIYYNLLGQPVSNPGPGIYIYNGKKVIIK